MTARIIICGTELVWNVNAKTAKNPPFFTHSGDYAKRVSKVCKAGVLPGCSGRHGPALGVAWWMRQAPAIRAVGEQRHGSALLTPSE